MTPSPGMTSTWKCGRNRGRFNIEPALSLGPVEISYFHVQVLQNELWINVARCSGPRQRPSRHSEDRLATATTAAAAGAAPATGGAIAIIGNCIAKQFFVHELLGGTGGQDEPTRQVGVVDPDGRAQHYFYVRAGRHLQVIFGQHCPRVR